jgi:hypothetical protein
MRRLRLRKRPNVDWRTRGSSKFADAKRAATATKLIAIRVQT